MNLQTQIEMMRDAGRFTRLVVLLLASEYNDFQAIDDTRGDGGNDGYLPSEKRMFARHCFTKPEKQKNDDAILIKLKGDLVKAVKRKKAGDYEIENWTFITNYALPDHIVQTMRDLAKKNDISAIHKGADYVASLALRHRSVLAEFPELDQVSLREEIHQRFDDLGNRLPHTPNAESQLIGDINEVLRELLIQLTLYGEKQVKPYLGFINAEMAQTREQIEDKLGTTARLIGEESDFYKELVTLSAELRAASTASLSLDGGQSYKARMEHVYKARASIMELMQNIGRYVTLSDLDDTIADIQRRLARWFDSFDETYSAFFEKAAEQATRLLRIYTYLYQAGKEADAERYAQLAKDIETLSQDDKSGFGEAMRVEIPILARRLRLIDLTSAEAELLSTAGENNGQIHKIRIDQMPPGHFVRVGEKSYASDTDASIARPYIVALDSLQEKHLVEHTSGILFTVTAKGWEKLGE